MNVLNAIFCIYVENKNVIDFLHFLCLFKSFGFMTSGPIFCMCDKPDQDKWSNKTGLQETGKSCDKGLPGGLLGRRTEQVWTNVFFIKFFTPFKKLCLGVALLTEKAPKGPRTGSRLTSCGTTFLSDSGCVMNQYI